MVRAQRASRLGLSWLAALLLAGAPGLAPAEEAGPEPAADAADASGWRVGRTPDVFGGEGVATRIGGWLDASYQDNDIDSSSLNLNHLNFFADTRLGSTWQTFLEVEFENEAQVRGFEGEREYEVEQAYVRWRPSDSLSARVGQFNTPFGFWTPVHWAILMDTITEPIHEGTRVTPEQQVGIELAGRVFLAGPDSDAELHYSAYLGYGDDSDLFKESETDGLAMGTDLRLSLRETTFVGLSLYQQDRVRKGLEDSTERSFMFYGEFHPLDPLTVRFEIFREFRDRAVESVLDRHINIGYLKARWDFSRVAYLNYRYGYGDDEGEGRSDERHTHTVTLGFRPTSALRLKLEYAGNQFRGAPRRDFHYVGVSVGLLF